MRIETSPDDFHGMAVAQGILTARGGATSHAAVVARQIGKPCVAGCAALVIDYATRTARSSQTGAASPRATGSASTARPARSSSARCRRSRPASRTSPSSSTILGWADEVRRLQVWTNADKPEEAALARSYGAQGIGLCRTEHMFREGERLDIVRDAILVALRGHAGQGRAARRARPSSAEDSARPSPGSTRAMAKLEELQQGDFEGIFGAMDGLPVVIRLIDPPLHEFLPNHDELLVEVTEYRVKGTARGRSGVRPGPRAAARPSSRCASRTRCSACAAAGSG